MLAPSMYSTLLLPLREASRAFPATARPTELVEMPHQAVMAVTREVGTREVGTREVGTQEVGTQEGQIILPTLERSPEVLSGVSAAWRSSA